MTLGQGSFKLVFAEDRLNPDFNNDGLVVRTEARAFYSQVFTFIDRDHDQQLTAAELLASYSSIGRRYSLSGFEVTVSMLDANNDNLLNHAEYLNGGMSRYYSSDFNGDGYVTAMEARNL